MRTTLTAAAAEGARAAAVRGHGIDDGRARIRTMLDGSVASGAVTSVDVRDARRGGLAVTVVELRATLPLLGMLGPQSLVVHGTAVREGP